MIGPVTFEAFDQTCDPPVWTLTLVAPAGDGNWMKYQVQLPGRSPGFFKPGHWWTKLLQHPSVPLFRRKNAHDLSIPPCTACSFVRIAREKTGCNSVYPPWTPSSPSRPVTTAGAPSIEFLVIMFGEEFGESKGPPL